MPVADVGPFVLAEPAEPDLEVAVSGERRRQRTCNPDTFYFLVRGPNGTITVETSSKRNRDPDPLPAVSSQSPRFRLMSSSATEPQSQKVLQVLTKTT